MRCVAIDDPALTETERTPPMCRLSTASYLHHLARAETFKSTNYDQRPLRRNAKHLAAPEASGVSPAGSPRPPPAAAPLPPPGHPIVPPSRRGPGRDVRGEMTSPSQREQRDQRQMSCSLWPFSDVACLPLNAW